MQLLRLSILAALGSLLGGWVVVRFLRGRASVMRLVSGVAAGYLLAVALMGILPECLSPENGGHANAIWILFGFLLVHLMEHGITPHFHYGEETHAGSRLSGVMALVGLSLHSLMDGVALAAALAAHGNLGMLLFAAILVHRIPEGGTIASIFLARGFGAAGAIMAAGVLALATLIGAWGQELLRIPAGPTLAAAAGLAIYVASSDLLPEVQKEPGWKSTFAIASGLGLYLVSAHFLPHP